MSETVDILEALNKEHAPTAPAVSLPEDTSVRLPIGLMTPFGLVTTAEVREMNGFDEEAIARAKSSMSRFVSLLERCVVKIGSEDATPSLLRELYLGDRMALLVAISRCTWGPKVISIIYCDKCNEDSEVLFSLDDLEVDTANPEDGEFLVDIKGGNATVHWPRGAAHEAVSSLPQGFSAFDFKNALLSTCVSEINGSAVYRDEVKRLSSADRTTLIKEINKGTNLGPRFDKTSVPCPKCGEEVSPAVDLGDLFPV